MAKAGGKRLGAGRKPKADEEFLQKKLSPLDDLAFKALKNGLVLGDPQFVKMFMEYRFGKPKQTIDNNVNGSLSINWEETKTYGSNG